MGHFARECPNKSNHHAHVVDVSESEEESHEETSPPKKKYKDSKREEAKREYFFVSALQGSISSSAWIIDSGASRHMSGDRDFLSDFSKSDSSNHIVLGNDAVFLVEG